MKNWDSRSKVIFGGFVSFVLIVFLVMIFRFLETKASERFFKSVETLYFSGKVIKETPLTSRISLYKINISSSTVVEHDRRGTGEDYLYVIHNGLGEAIIENYLIKVGDSISFSGKHGSFLIFRDDKIIGTAVRGRYDFKELNKAAKRLHEL